MFSPPFSQQIHRLHFLNIAVVFLFAGTGELSCDSFALLKTTG
jgi:hypothetical protein